MPTNINPYQTIPVYLARNLSELEDLARNDAFRKMNKADRIESICQKLFVELRGLTHDQEKCYVIGRRYLDLLDRLWTITKEKNVTFDRHLDEWTKVSRMMLELRTILMKRYDDAREEQKLEEDRKNVLKELAADPTAGARSLNFPLTRPVFPEPYISSSVFYKAILRNEDMLLIDIRPEEDFKASRVKFQNTINIPPEVILPGLSAHSLTPALNTAAQQIWNVRNNFAVLVLMDWNSDSENVMCTKLDRLRILITEWDPNRKYHQHPVYLYGGFAHFMETYPSQVTNCHVFLIRKNENIDELLELDNLEYPDVPKNQIEIKLKKFSINDVKEEKEEGVAFDDATIDENIMSADFYDFNFDFSDDEPSSPHFIPDEQADDNYKKARYVSPFEGVQFSDVKLPAAGSRSSLTVNFDSETGETGSSKASDTDSRASLRNFDSETGEDTQPSPPKVSDEESEGKGDESDKEKPPGDGKLEMMKLSPRKTQSDGNESLNIRELLEAVQKDPRLSSLFKPELPPKPKDLSSVGDIWKFNEPPLICRATKPVEDKEAPEGWCGLFNIKNTCYQNTALQCLKCLPAIRYIFTQTNYKKHLTVPMPKLMVEFGIVIKALWRGTENAKKIFRAMKFYDTVCNLNVFYKKGAHEDCLEFFLFVLTYLTEDCQREMNRPSVMTEREKAWFSQLQGQTSIFVDLFYHQFACRKICQNCRNQVTSYESDNTLMLPIPKREKIYLRDLVLEYTEDNQIIDFKCTKCNKMNIINKKDVVVSPEILVIVLKRYYQDEYFQTKKNNAPVEFDLNLSFGKHQYKLYSIAEHRGTMNHGHYYAHGILKEGEEGNDLWVEFNDEKVNRFYGQINANADVKNTVCAFFYYKQK